MSSTRCPFGHWSPTSRPRWQSTAGPTPTVTAGDDVVLSASASGPDDRVEAVEFYVDGTRVRRIRRCLAGSRGLGQQKARGSSRPWRSTPSGTHDVGARDGDRVVPRFHRLRAPGMRPPGAARPRWSTTPGPAEPDSIDPRPLQARLFLQFTAGVPHLQLQFARPPTSFDHRPVRAAMCSNRTRWPGFTLDLGLPAVSNGMCMVDCLGSPLAWVATFSSRCAR